MASYAYDRAQRLLSVANRVDASAIAERAYALDAEGNRVSALGGGGRFDPLGFAYPVAWSGIEIALAISDAVSTVEALIDPKASDSEKAAAVALFAASVAAPGGGGPTLVRRARNVGGGRATIEAALNGAERWLQPGYKEIAPGVFRSADGARQFRMTDADILRPRIPHVHFEAIAPGGRVIENAHVDLLLR